MATDFEIEISRQAPPASARGFQCLAFFMRRLSLSIVVSGAAMLAPHLALADPTPLPSASPQSGSQASPIPIPRVNVQGNAATPTPAEGTEAAGYKPTSVNNVGPLGQKAILDTPYSINVIPSDFFENRLNSNAPDVLEYSPVVQVSAPNSRAFGEAYYLRGFLSQYYTVDGLFADNFDGINDPEDKERAEIETGLTGFLYGVSDVGGMVNWVYKKPTAMPLANLTVGDYGGGSMFLHGDFGGPIGSGDKFGYRLNLVGQSGPTDTPPQSEQRLLVTSVFDWRPNAGTTLEYIFSHADEALHGLTAVWQYETGQAFTYGTVPDPSKYWSQTFNEYRRISDREEASIASKLSSALTFRAAYGYDTTRTPGPFLSQGDYWIRTRANTISTPLETWRP